MGRFGNGPWRREGASIGELARFGNGPFWGGYLGLPGAPFRARNLYLGGGADPFPMDLKRSIGTPSREPTKAGKKKADMRTEYEPGLIVGPGMVDCAGGLGRESLAFANTPLRN